MDCYILWSSSSRVLAERCFADEVEMVIWNPTVCWLQLFMCFVFRSGIWSQLACYACCVGRSGSIYAAESELLLLLDLLATGTLDPSRSDRRTIRGSASAAPSASCSYSLALSHLPDDPFAPHIWRNDAPPKCRTFLWEVHQHKLNTNFRLHVDRGGNNDGLCRFCGGSEDVPHLFLRCPHVQVIWSSIGLLTISVDQVEQLWELDLPGPPLLCQRTRSTVLSAILWNIWKRRNARVFNNETEPLGCVLRHCAHDLELWSNRVILYCSKLPSSMDFLPM